MEDTRENAPAVLNYASTPDAGGWPVGWFVVALVWAYFTLLLPMELAKDRAGELRNLARSRGQIALVACVALRLVWARLSGEKSKVWVFYVAVLAFAAPLWLYVEPLLRR